MDLKSNMRALNRDELRALMRSVREKLGVTNSTGVRGQCADFKVDDPVSIIASLKTVDYNTIEDAVNAIEDNAVRISILSKLQMVDRFIDYCTEVSILFLALHTLLQHSVCARLVYSPKKMLWQYGRLALTVVDGGLFTKGKSGKKYVKEIASMTKNHAMFSVHTNCQLHRDCMAADIEKAIKTASGIPVFMLATAGSASDIIDMLPTLAHVRCAKGTVLMMKGCYGSARPDALLLDGREITKYYSEAFFGPRPTADEHAMLIEFPLSDVYMRELGQGNRSASSTAACSEQEQKCLEELSRSFKSQKITVLLIEVFTSDLMLGLSKVFLRDLRKLCTEHSVDMVVDDTMCAIRSGRFFSFMHHQDVDFEADMVIVGKLFLNGFIFSVRSTRHDQRYQQIGCVVTSHCDKVTMDRIHRFIEVVHEHKLAECCVEIGEAIAASGIAPARGIGPMYSTSAKLKGTNAKFSRLFPSMDVDPRQLTDDLRNAMHRASGSSSRKKPRSGSAVCTA